MSGSITDPPRYLPASAWRHDQNGATAILLESIGREIVSHQPSVAELADAAGWIASDPLAQRTVVIVARIDAQPITIPELKTVS
jgi:hypothetical protein